MATRFLVVCLVLCLMLSLTGTVFAHGARIDYTVDMVVGIQASYDTGEPMSQAQVAVFAPGDPSNPWLTGECDEQGRFSFSPDPDQPGTWDIQVRHQGHGDMVHLELGQEGAPIASGSTGFTVPQIIIMGGCVLWGLTGTALYFSRKKEV